MIIVRSITISWWIIFLIRNIIVVNIRGDDGATPLHYAAKFYKPKREDDQAIQVQGSENKTEGITAELNHL